MAKTGGNVRRRRSPLMDGAVRSNSLRRFDLIGVDNEFVVDGNQPRGDLSMDSVKLRLNAQ
jgi:hypothetical protein